MAGEPIVVHHIANICQQVIVLLLILYIPTLALNVFYFNIVQFFYFFQYCDDMIFPGSFNPSKLYEMLLM